MESYVIYFILAFSVLNVIALAILKRLSKAAEPSGDTDLFARLNGPLKPYALDWFRLTAEQWPVYEAEARRMHRFGYVYAPFVEFRHPPMTGVTLNMSEHGFRPVVEQGPWPPSLDHYVIFLFGGSTAMHFGPDWTGVANRLQTVLAEAGGRPVRIYNFGRGAYFSSQEMILYLDLLQRGYVPDMAIFLDGLNDFYFHDNVPATGAIFRNALQEHLRRTFATTGGGPLQLDWRALREFWNSLPALRLMDRMIDRHLIQTNHATVYRTETLDPAAENAVIQRYFFNKSIIERASEAMGTSAVFVWQPVPGYRYNLCHHVAMHPTQGLCGHERSGVGYIRMMEWITRCPPGPNFLWLADLQEKSNEPLYVDTVHYTAAFADRIAEAIAEALTTRNLLVPRNMERTDSIGAGTT